MPGATKRAKKVRRQSEFDVVRLAAALQPPKVTIGSLTWGLDEIRDARADQMLGRFRLPARLGEAMRTDYALFFAWLNRLAPQRGIPVALRAANKSARADSICKEADALFGPTGVGIHPDTLSDINSDIANHGIAFAYNVQTPRLDGSRVDFELRYWPIEFVWRDPISRLYRTQIDLESWSENNEEIARAASPYFYGVGGFPIVHGDGRWVVFQKHEYEPYKKDAAVLPGALLWADHAFGVRDRAKASTAHGNAKIVGQLPEGIAIDSEEGRAFYTLLQLIASADTPVGIKPFGATLEYIVNNSQAWQIFKEIIDSGDKAASRIYLGQDSTIGTNGQAPGIDVTQLFGVRDDIVEGDLKCIERGILTGTVEPWTAINFGDSSLAPFRCYLMADGDEAVRTKSQDEHATNVGNRVESFYRALEAAHTAGIPITQDLVDVMAADYRISAPRITTSIPGAPAPATGAPVSQAPPASSA